VGVVDVRHRLAAVDLPRRLECLGFRGPDVRDALAAAAAVLREDGGARVQRLAERLLPAVGTLELAGLPDPWADDAAGDDPSGPGVLPLLALVATVEEVVAAGARRGIGEDQVWRSLSDLGQQVWVHRLTYGSFGLHTQDWLRLAWSGNLHWLGRLQFNLQVDRGEWVASTHIPQTGPLRPDLVDESFARAAAFFARHYPDVPVVDFHCHSWLLDPQLAAALPPDSNLARFQRRWRLYGEPQNGDADVVFFTFHRRGEVDVESLPRTTTLERVVVEGLRAGRPWQLWHGRLIQGETDGRGVAGPAR
jgi:hypothetical protein